ncbi:hypothetical protein [Agrilutibacter solisilvae]|uniref:Uncharacterized protein n=1 Tax=Agrilutibacter solisilvae TaxID=2763317 RepID=A0A974XWW9_9GAMM|nr:hypothetical protein [Lysobacter solisilvae]QSX77218.1 hypothetical protein I8J32_010445 [Lysobacter solisilvae]
MRVVMAGVLGGVLLFLWGMVAHMMLPFSENAMLQIPDEERVIAAAQGNITQSGVYFFPYVNYMQASPQEQDAYAAKLARGPSGLLVVRAGGYDMDMIPELPIEAISNILAALLAAMVVWGLRVATYGRRVASIFAFGVVAWLSVCVSQWTWYGFSTPFLISDLVDQWGGWLVAGLGMAAVLRPRA